MPTAMPPACQCRRPTFVVVTLLVFLQACVLLTELGGVHSRGGSVTATPAAAPPAVPPHAAEAAMLNDSASAASTVADAMQEVSIPSTRRRAAAGRHPRRGRRLNNNGSSPFFPGSQLVSRESLPNVLLMIADDMQPRDLGLGYTPHIEAIGREGVSFANAHTPGPLCTPSRYALLTGRHPSCHFGRRGGGAPPTPLVQQVGINGTSALLPDLQPIEFNINLPIRAPAVRAADAAAGSDGGAGGGGGGGLSTGDDGLEPMGESRDQCTTATIGTLLRERGYATGIFGKWHLGYPALGPTAAAERERIVGSPSSAWRTVKATVLSEYRAVQQHVRRCGFDVAERLYVNNLYPEQHVRRKQAHAPKAPQPTHVQ